MKKIYRNSILILAILIISVILFITGKKHDVFILNNTSNEIKYSINGQPYKVIRAKKKIKTFAKGIGNNIYFKNSNGKVIERDLDLGIGKNIEISIKEIFENSKSWYKEIE
ncbi:MAG: hypothetical protein CR959_00790 [Fusobacteriales bacterium]|nr:MAG: hypothetical protein CR959_00790 [Fusobacteriales bacterium]